MKKVIGIFILAAVICSCTERKKCSYPVPGYDDKLKRASDRRTAYLRTLMSEPDLIETDYPAEWVDLPVDRKTIRSMSKSATRK